MHNPLARTRPGHGGLHLARQFSDIGASISTGDVWWYTAKSMWLVISLVGVAYLLGKGKGRKR